MTCQHLNMTWNLAPATETGWECAWCSHKPGEPPGFDPTADRQHTRRKVETVLMSLHDSEVVYVSNGEQGDWIVTHVAKRCAELDAYDQLTVVRLICETMSDTHADYWRKIANGVLTGNDTRDRCHCGALATCWEVGYRSKTATCTAHAHLFGDPDEG